MHIGDIDGLPKDIAEELTAIKEKTAAYTGTSVVLAINYGGRNEIIRAIQKLKKDETADLTESLFSDKLDTHGIPPVDLFIRTGGEKRLSNFLLWQSAYAELYFSDKLWPDWTPEDLQQAVNDYMHRERRYGSA